MYSNKEEFKENLTRLVKSKSLRDKLGSSAFEYVKNHRLEKLHTLSRYEFYSNVIKDKTQLYNFEVAS